MQVSDDLFQLIKSLTQTEKRYFKLLASLHHNKGSDNNYLKLFNAMEKQKEYDEGKIRKKFKNEKFLKQLFVVKNYLYNNILKSMRLYYSEKSKTAELSDLLRDIDILYDKSLFSQCRKIIEKAKKIAAVYEMYPQLIILLDREMAIARVSSYVNFEEKKLAEIKNEQQKAIQEINNINDYWQLSMKTFLMRKKYGEIRNKMELKKFNELIKHPLLNSENRASNFLSKSQYLNLKGLYYLINKDYENLLIISKRLVEHLESNKLLMNLENYVSSLNNLSIVQVELKNYEDALANVKKLRSIETASSSLKIRIFVRSYDTELNIYLRSGNFEKGIHIVREINERMKDLKGKINKESETLFAYNISYLYFGVGDYINSLKYVNKVINDKELKIREDLQCFARILNLLIHYELGNYDLIDYAVKSTQRYLSRKNKLNKFELVTLNHIRNLINADVDEDIAFIFTEWKNELVSISADVIELKAFEYIDLISWIDSKLLKKDFAELVQSKSLNSKLTA